jgi:hypothetical protein
MFNPEASPQSQFFMRSIEAAAPSLGVRPVALPVRATADIEAAVESFARLPNGGLILPTDSFILLRFGLVAELAARHRLPSISAQTNSPGKAASCRTEPRSTCTTSSISRPPTSTVSSILPSGAR